MLAPAPPVTFCEGLQVALKLTVSGKSFTIIAGDIKRLEIQLYSYGFEAMVAFAVAKEFFSQTEDLLAQFVKNDLMEAELSVQGYFNLPKSVPDALVLKGIVREKALSEILDDPLVDGTPIIFRNYTVCFADVAQVLWKQHYPCELYVDSTMKTLLNAHKGSKVKVTYDWSILDTQHPILFLGLGDERNDASFYDFVMWYIDSRDGVFTYDSSKDTYKISQNKDAKGTAIELPQLDVEGNVLSVYYPEPPRHKVRVLNGYCEKPQTQEIANSYQVEGVSKDVYVRTAIPAAYNARKTLETSHLKIRELEPELHFRRFPTVTFKPGTLVSFDGKDWHSKLVLHGKQFRVVAMSIVADATRGEPLDDDSRVVNSYEITMNARLEKKEDPHVKLPHFAKPHYPVYVEGKIVSEKEGASDHTYHIYQDSNSIDRYKVTVPLWSNKKVISAYNPNLFSSHFYFPAIKDARVLLALEFQDAWIKRFLDWREGARLTQDSQGNQILFGWDANNNKTSIAHTYTDKKPQLEIKRVKESDTELIQLKEGTMILQTKEEK